MTDRFMLRTPKELEYFNSEDELLARVRAIYTDALVTDQSSGQ